MPVYLHSERLTPFKDLPRHLFLPSANRLPGLTFRPARRTDMSPLHASCYARRPPAQFRDSFRRALEAQKAGRLLLVVAEREDKKLIGSGRLVSMPDKVEIADLAVAPPYRRQGVGTALIDVLTRIAAHAGFSRVEIGVMAANVQALALYERLGFKRAKEIALPGAVRALILQKEVPAPDIVVRYPSSSVPDEESA